MTTRSTVPIGALFGLALLVAGADALSEALTASEVAELTHSARLDLAASAGASNAEDSIQPALVRALNETDPARREAMLSVWLRDWVGPEPAAEPRPADLQLLTAFDPVVETVHHEHPHRSIPAFNVAGHARNRLEEQAVRIQARAMQDRPDAIQKALSAPVGSRTFRAGLRAAMHAPSNVRRALAGLFASKRGSGADAATLALIDAGLVDANALLDVVEFAPAATALAAVRRIELLDGEARDAAIDLALDRPELGGLPIALAALTDANSYAGSDAGSHKRSTTESLDQRLWALLDDTQRGADAALALAHRIEDLASEVHLRFDSAPPRARLRMLLALKLQASPSSDALLAELRRERLTPSESSATEAWR